MTRGGGVVVPLAVCLLLATVPGCRTVESRDAVIRAVDADGDGRADRFEVLAEDGSVVRATVAPEPGSDPGRTVVLAIDAIPYDLFARLQAEGLFAAFHPAGRLVAPFPSLTDVSFTRILRTAPAASYEDRYFDRERNRIAGGIGERLTGEYRELAPFHAAFDWEEPRMWGAFVYLVPERVAVAELSRVEEVLRESDDEHLVVYLGSTDGLGHEEGWAALEAHLRRVDRVLVRFLVDGGGARRVVLLSDHGMSRGPTRRFDLEATLERAGFDLADRIDAPTDVVAPAYGLVGSIQLYAACGVEEAVARAVVAGEGADFAVWREGDRVRAVDAAGSADPLDRPGGEYPDLRRRVRAALLAPAVRHPASVIVSLEDGWHWGLELFEPFVSMEGTHGSARYTSSVGLLASNVDAVPAWVAADDARPYLGLPDRPDPFAPTPDPCGGPTGARGESIGAGGFAAP